MKMMQWIKLDGKEYKVEGYVQTKADSIQRNRYAVDGTYLLIGQKGAKYTAIKRLDGYIEKPLRFAM
jgi:hypothetical protein